MCFSRRCCQSPSLRGLSSAAQDSFLLHNLCFGFLWLAWCRMQLFPYSRRPFLPVFCSGVRSFHHSLKGASIDKCIAPGIRNSFEGVLLFPLLLVFCDHRICQDIHPSENLIPLKAWIASLGVDCFWFPWPTEPHGHLRTRCPHLWRQPMFGY